MLEPPKQGTDIYSREKLGLELIICRVRRPSDGGMPKIDELDP